MKPTPLDSKNPNCYTQRDLCNVLSASRTTIHRMDKRREIPGRMKFTNGMVRYWKPAVDAWLRDQQHTR